MTKSKFPLVPVLASLATACLLAACGGGGGGDSSAAAAATPAGGDAGTGTGQVATVTPPATTNTGSVSANFAAAASARYFMYAVGSQSSGTVAATVQDATGAMTKINDYVLSGMTSVKEIAGSVSYAQGRWAAGNVARPNGADTLTGTTNAAYHYLVFNNVSAYPTSGSAACDAGAFTAPSYVGGASSSGNFGTATGSATVSFNSAGATVTGTLSNVVGGSSGSINFSATGIAPTSSGITGAFFSGGPGAQIAVGADGASGYLVAAGYSVTLANGARYQGVASFRCK